MGHRNALAARHAQQAERKQEAATARLQKAHGFAPKLQPTRLANRRQAILSNRTTAFSKSAAICLSIPERSRLW
jgi:hypothetical protein